MKAKRLIDQEIIARLLDKYGWILKVRIGHSKPVRQTLFVQKLPEIGGKGNACRRRPTNRLMTEH